MVPELSEPQLQELPSQGEAKVYRAFRDLLPRDYLVLFQVGWIVRRETEGAKDGETDFIVCHPDHGYFCLEVKGGGIGFDAPSGDWFSIDRHHSRHDIKNPIGQARRAKYSIRSKLREHPRWDALNLDRVLRGHAVFFPDMGNSKGFARPDMPEAVIGTSLALENVQRWVDGVFSYWGTGAGTYISPGRIGVELIREVFARSFEIAPLVSSRLAEQEARRIELTREQLRILDFLQSHRRVAVSGGAGTGKTVLALEKARRLASEGFHTLLTCYNRPLADHLAMRCRGVDKLSVMSFHQLCHSMIKIANRESGRDLIAEAKATYPGQDLFDVHLPNALAYSVEVVAKTFDAIVCDEGQDFRDEYWVPLELLLDDYERSPFYVFFDDNQNVYARAGTFPIRDEPFNLTINCRNTAPIHKAAYEHYKGVMVEPPAIDGDDVQFEVAPNLEAQATKIHARVVDLLSRQGVKAEEITVLIADARHKNTYYSALQKRPLPKPAMWQDEVAGGANYVLLDTVRRFKGLESPIIIIWGLDALDLSSSHELLYVGISRAQSLLILVGSQDTCEYFAG